MTNAATAFAVRMLGAALVAATASVALPAAPAQAQRVTALNGARLQQICSSRRDVESKECLAYLSGVADSIDFYQDLLPQDGSRGGRLPAYVCVPQSVTGPDMRSAVVQWIGSHPEANQRTAQWIVPRALHDAYRCR